MCKAGAESRSRHLLARAIDEPVLQRVIRWQLQGMPGHLGFNYEVDIQVTTVKKIAHGYVGSISRWMIRNGNKGLHRMQSDALSLIEFPSPIQTRKPRR
jgi:hypothetical protein